MNMYLDKLIDLQVRYKSQKNDVINEFYVPVLSNSVLYDRAVGFFSSNILVEYIAGLQEFIDNQGKMRLIISPRLSDTDIETIINANLDKTMETVAANMTTDFIKFKESKESDLSAQILYKLIIEGIIEIRVVVPETTSGMFHDKISIFKDEADMVITTSGSNNETLNAVKFNYESFDVHKSWIAGQSEYCDSIEEDFIELWQGNVEEFKTCSIEECIEDNILKMYDSDKDIKDLYRELKKQKIEKDNEDRKNLGFKPYQFQTEAANDWLEKKRGIISFATGVGKTKTALLGMHKYIEKFGNKIFMIVVPDKTLVEQWAKQLKNYAVVKCYSDNSGWQSELAEEIGEFSLDKKTSLCIITTNSTFLGDKFQKKIKKLKNDFVFISDECHHLGTEKLLGMLPDTEYRLGLSATPEIYMSEDKTKRLFAYFDGILASYSLGKAIKNNFLVPYSYHPLTVELTENEMEKYKEISAKLVKMLGTDDEFNMQNLSIEAQMILFKRSRILYGASNKIDKLDKLWDSLFRQKHVLVYCGATSTDNQDEDAEQRAALNEFGLTQLERVNKLLVERGSTVFKYTKDENALTRQNTLERFKSGITEVITAIKCLDEGVDIPQIQTAVIMASSGNPREFIQRRGRLLRTSDGKTSATIYDMTIIGEGDDYKNINKIELKRMYEFINDAQNKEELLAEYSGLLSEYEIGEDNE